MQNPVSNLIEYLKSSYAELMKVTWPSRRDTIRYSALVIAVSIVTAGFFAALDFGLSQGVQTLLSRDVGSAVQDPNALPVTPDVEATTPDGSPADVQVETVPVDPGNRDIPAPTPTPGN